MAHVRVAKIDQSPWPDMASESCSGSIPEHPAEWMIWTDVDTGDGMRLACSDDLDGWVKAVWERIDGWGPDDDDVL